jgi:acyl carrier protein
LYIEKTIMRILVDELFVSVPPSRIGLRDSLRDILGLDSLAFSELRVRCEYTFGVTISDEDFVSDYFSSVGTLADLVLRLREALPDRTNVQ